MRRRGRVLAITILHHADSRRVGDRVLLPHLVSGPVALGRAEPVFAPPEGGSGAPLDDGAVSARPLVFDLEPDGVLVLSRADHESSIRVDGVEVADSLLFEPGEIERGVVVELAHRVALLLHLRSAIAPQPAPRYGLIGESEAIERARAAIASIAARDVPVLLRGESGSGRERIARAIHDASGRTGPFKVLNMAALSPAMAASELFGHVRGAFPGAVLDRIGSLRAADGGTVLLHEIGDAPLEVQSMILRTLTTGLVHPIGSAHPVPLGSVRLVTATDVDLERAVSQGAFRSTLLERLAEFQMPVPALRDRRDDIGRLLFAFVREELGERGARDRLDRVDAPWISTELVSRLTRHAWPGNVRQLRKVARHMVAASRDEPFARLGAAAELVLAYSPQRSSIGAPTSEQENGGDDGRRPSDVTTVELLETLRACAWKLGPTAERLRISRSSLYDLIDRTPEIRRASEVSRHELDSLARALGTHDVETLAEHLCVSPAALRLHLNKLGRWRDRS